MKSDSTIISYENIDFEIHYDYLTERPWPLVPEEEPNLDPESPTCGPGAPAEIEIWSISVNSDKYKRNIIEIVKDDIIEYFEEQVAQIMNED